MDPELTPTDPTQRALESAHVLLDALSIFLASPGTHLSPSDVAGKENQAQVDSAIQLALTRLHDVEAIHLILDPETSHPRVDATPLLRATLALLTSLSTMLEIADPTLDDLTLMGRLREVIDLTFDG